MIRIRVCIVADGLCYRQSAAQCVKVTVRSTSVRIVTQVFMEDADMQVKGIHHTNIGCRESDLPAIKKFYCDGLGLTVGPRPDFPNKGLWLYCGDHPLVHVVSRFKPDWPGIDEQRSGYDHTAYAVTGVHEFRARLKQAGIVYDEQNVPNAGFQMFMRDPVGNKVELNFPNEEVPDDVASGTLSATQFPDQARAK